MFTCAVVDSPKAHTGIDNYSKIKTKELFQSKGFGSTFKPSPGT